MQVLPSPIGVKYSGTVEVKAQNLPKGSGSTALTICGLNNAAGQKIATPTADDCAGANDLSSGLVKLQQWKDGTFDQQYTLPTSGQKFGTNQRFCDATHYCALVVADANPSTSGVLHNDRTPVHRPEADRWSDDDHEAEVDHQDDGTDHGGARAPATEAPTTPPTTTTTAPALSVAAGGSATAGPGGGQGSGSASIARDSSRGERCVTHASVVARAADGTGRESGTASGGRGGDASVCAARRSHPARWRRPDCTHDRVLHVGQRWRRRGVGCVAAVTEPRLHRSVVTDSEQRAAVRRMFAIGDRVAAVQRPTRDGTCAGARSLAVNECALVAREMGDCNDEALAEESFRHSR